MQNHKFTSWLISIVIIVAILIYGKSIILPFVIAVLIWFVVKKMRNLIDKISFIKKYVPAWIKSIFASLLIFVVLFVIAKVLINSIEGLATSYENYAKNIEVVGNRINNLFKINVNEELVTLIKDFNFKYYLSILLNSLSDILGNMVMIIFYIVFLFVEELLFKNKFKLIYTDKVQYERNMAIIKKIDRSLSSYISLKSLISLLTTTLSYFVLLAVGIDSALFWAFLIFMFNFIPSIGPILGTLLPALFSLIQFGTFFPFLIILLGVGAIAVLVGSLVEPRIMGNTLNISPLVAILSLAIWGAIWGITGMLLSVPITVAMIIIFSQFTSTRSIAILLSEKGKV